MSLWSPVDLVTGERAQNTVRTSPADRTNELIGQVSESHRPHHTKRRGRRPKSILTSASSLPIIVVPAIDDGKPKKRGRPPLLSPPLINSKVGEIPTTSSPDSLANANSRLAISALNLGSNNSNLLQPGWPTFTPSGVIVFPSTPNENKVDSSSSGSHTQKRQRHHDFSDGQCTRSVDDTRRDDTDSEGHREDTDSDSHQNGGSRNAPKMKAKPNNDHSTALNLNKTHFNERESRHKAETAKRTQEREFKKYQNELQKEQLEMQKRRELQMMAEIERERRKQHILLVRALDAHKRQEERERKREEMLAEKRAMKERKMQKKRLEMELLRELKKPVDDMVLKDLTPLPTLNRIPGLKLAGKAFADLLMIYEFLHNFGETLGFDMDSLPSLNTLQEAVLNLDKSAEEELLSIIHHLLVCVIDDPGIPFNVTTLMGQKLKDAPITNYNITEILRLYFQSFATQISDDSPIERVEVRLFEIINTGRPFLSLNATHKTEILSFLCNELLCNQAIVRQIEDNIESVSNLRRDKWVVENDLRKYRAIKNRREKRSEEQDEEESKKGEKSETEVVVGEESGYSDGEDNAIVCVPLFHDSYEEPEMTNEEVDKKVEVLSRKCTMLTNKLNKAIHGLRVNSLGQDRYRRRYWVLPAAGGVFVEGLQSGEPEEIENNRIVSNGVEDVEMQEDNQAQQQEDEEVVSVKCPESDVDVKTASVTEMSPKPSGDHHTQETNGHTSENKTEDVEAEADADAKDNKDVKREEKEEITKVEGNSNDKLLKVDEKCATSAENSVMSGLESPWFSPIVASVLAGSMMFNNNANHSGNGFPPFPLSFPLDLSLKPKKPSQRPWFSILPRMPCNDTQSLTADSVIKDNVAEKCHAKRKADQLENPVDTNPSRFGSLVNSLPTNLFMQAFLYPHIFGSLFQQNQCPSFPMNSQSHFLMKDNASKTASHPNSSQEAPSQGIVSSPSTAKSDTEMTATNTHLIETDICPALQRKLAAQKREQHSEPQKIPEQFQCGWWRITDPSQLRNISEVLHERGVRERQLHKHLTKYFNYVSNKCKSNAAEFDITESMDREISQECPFGAPKEQLDDDWSADVALKLDISVLEQIEALEEKIASSSMQIRGWRPPPRRSCDHISTFKVSKAYGYEVSQEDNKEKEEDDDEDDDEDEKDESTVSSDGKPENPVKVGRQRLLAAEAVIERRYLKPPLGFKCNTLIATVSMSHNSDEYADNAADENAPNGLLRWRDAVRECKTGSQLALLLHFLESCIAWDKSIMRASCQFCSSGEDEAQLLLCDGCDKGYHTYCFKPKMETIPEGDWFCFECQNKNTIDKVCVVCGKKGKLLNCDTCPKVFHPNCIDPPMTKPPKGRWSCSMCNRKPKKPKCSRKSPAVAVSVDEKPSKEAANNAVTTVAKEPKKSNSTSKSGKASKGEATEAKDTKKEKKTKLNKDLTLCETLLSEMEKHEDAWPFLFAVNTKQFPTYKKIIKKPMDLAAIRSKIESGSYKSKTDFMNDCRLIFDNCETFNEDESPVGIAGHNMRAFWVKRSKELMDKI